MNWIKKGLIFAPSGNFPWMASYAHLPTAQLINSSTIRIYFASLDDQKRGRIGCVDVERDNPSKLLSVSNKPVLDVGGVGSFDEFGVNPSCIVQHKNETLLYYIGWSKPKNVPYRLLAGVAHLKKDGKWEKVSAEPILPPTENEPDLRSATWVIPENGVLRMWYVSGNGWIKLKDRTHPRYVIKRAESKDGLIWKDFPETCIGPLDQNEYGFGRPMVIKESGAAPIQSVSTYAPAKSAETKGSPPSLSPSRLSSEGSVHRIRPGVNSGSPAKAENNSYKMWYSIRSLSQPYRIGYAESNDGIQWTRMDERVGIERSSSGWDSEMICYANVLKVDSKYYMFYNGNQHGASGFGWALGS